MSGLEGSEKKDCFSKHLLHRISTIDATLATHARTISARAEERIGRNIGESGIHTGGEERGDFPPLSKISPPF